MPLPLSSADCLAISPSVFSVFWHSHKNCSFHSSPSVHLDAVDVKLVGWMFEEERDDSHTGSRKVTGLHLSWTSKGQPGVALSIHEGQFLIEPGIGSLLEKPVSIYSNVHDAIGTPM